MLYKMVFWISSKVVASPLDSKTAKAYLFNQGGTASLLSRLACHILNLADKHGITLIPAYILTHLNVEAISSGQLRLDFIFGVNQRWICWDLHILMNVCAITP